MRKILSGFLGIVAILAVVSASAYAAFTTTATASGITLTAATAGLFIGPTSDSVTTNSLPNIGSATLVPGVIYSNDFYLENSSNAGITLGVTAKITHHNVTSWSDLSPLIWAQVVNGDDNSDISGWHTLADWEANGVSLGSLTDNLVHHYKINYKLDNSAPDSLQGKSVSSITITLTGTQQ
jgi:hypothetical protein